MCPDSPDFNSVTLRCVECVPKLCVPDDAMIACRENSNQRCVSDGNDTEDIAVQDGAKETQRTSGRRHYSSGEGKLDCHLHTS